MVAMWSDCTFAGAPGDGVRSSETFAGDQVSVLASQAGWAWPGALRDIFKPRRVNLLVARGADEFASIIESRRIHTAIIDLDSPDSGGFGVVRVVRMADPLVPCIVLSASPDREVLGRALELDVFSVIAKPVDMSLLRQQLNRLFIKKYGSYIFD